MCEDPTQFGEAERVRAAERYNDLGIALARQSRPIEAERAWRHAIQFQPDYPKPYRNLGVLFTDSGRFADAAIVLQTLARLEPDVARVHFDLGTALLRAGKAADAIEPLRRAVELNSNDGPAHAHLGLALEEIGEVAEAIASLRHARRLMPESPIVDYHLGAIGGATAPPRCPPEYLVPLFDGYAGRFDEDLVERLGYYVPRLLAEAIHRAGATPRSLDILDLGCGTGLCGKSLRSLAKSLAGVDLSPRMIEVSGARGVYDQLFQCDVLTALSSHQGTFDLITAGDVFIYIGDLRELFRVAAAALRPGGLFAFTIEVIETGDYALCPTRRYAHSRDYIQRLASENSLSSVSDDSCILRSPPPVDGAVILLRK